MMLIRKRYPNAQVIAEKLKIGKETQTTVMLVYDRDKVHYVRVKANFRGTGIIK